MAGKSITSEKILLKNVRLSFPELFKPKPFQQGQEPYFKANFLLDPTNAEHKAIIKILKEEITRLTKEAFDGKPLEAHRLCVGDGNTKSYAGYKDHIFVSASNKTRPVVVNRKREPVAEGDSEAPYAGCYVNATITLWTQDNSFGKRINANLRAVQFVKDGEAFGVAPVDAEDEFEPLEAGEESGGDDMGFLNG